MQDIVGLFDNAGDFAGFLERFGYPILFVGVLLEGEMILVLAGAFAHAGTLALGDVILVAWLASTASDQGIFQLSYRYGTRLLAHWPRLARRLAYGERLVRRFGDAIVFSFRFIYGARTVTPLLLGLQRYPRLRFAAINIVAAGVWAAAIASLGYVLSASLAPLLRRIAHVQLLLLGLAAVAVIVFVVRRWRAR